MPLVTFDTCIFITHKPSYFPKGFRLTAVVLHELTVGAADKARLRYWDAVRTDFERDEKLLVPNGEDWFLAGKILNSLQRGTKLSNKGKVARISPTESHRIFRDVLIARSAKRAGAAIVTDNVRDFEKIRSYCNVRLIKPKGYFGI